MRARNGNDDNGGRKVRVTEYGVREMDEMDDMDEMINRQEQINGTEYMVVA